MRSPTSGAARRLSAAWRNMWRVAADARGAATTEYALLLALIVVVLIGTLTTLGGVLNDKLKDIIAQVSGAG